MGQIIEYNINMINLYQQGLQLMISEHKTQLKALSDILAQSDTNWKGPGGSQCYNKIVSHMDEIVGQLDKMMELHKKYGSYSGHMVETDNSYFANQQETTIIKPEGNTGYSTGLV